jgi:formylglycine-generating enzyme required for sulfatase activity
LCLAVFGLVLVLAAGCMGGGSGRGPKVDYQTVKAATIDSSINPGSPGKIPAPGGCPAGMVLIPAGPTIYGPNDEKAAAGSEKDGGQRINMKAYCIDRYEYPNEAGEAPLRSATWLEAQDQCGKRGKRLCSEHEFEKACRGPSGASRYAYGDGYAAKVCPSSDQDYNLGQYADCVSGFGVNDMSGGVFEWSGSPASGDQSKDDKVLRGGMSSEGGEASSRCTFRRRLSAVKSSREVGFRCCAALTKE